jgi:ABC-type glycerol-3-phosphate transport system permease component
MLGTGKRQKMMFNFFLYCMLALILAFALLPFLWLLACTFKPRETLFAVVPQWIPRPFTLANYGWAFGRHGPNLFQTIRNSLGTSFFTAIFTLIFSTSGAYAMARFGKVKGFKTISVILLLSQMFQGPLIMVPWYKMAVNLRILNTWLVLILIYLTASIPICIWLMVGYFVAVPAELEESAYIDGCGPLHSFFSIVLPLTKPGLVAVGIYAFILSWNDYQYAMVLSKSMVAKTAQVAVSEQLASMGAMHWGGIMASGIVISLPVIILFAFVQKYLVAGLMSGAVKG